MYDRSLRVQSIVAAMLLIAIGSQCAYFAPDGLEGGGTGNAPSEGENVSQDESTQQGAAGPDDGEDDDPDDEDTSSDTPIEQAQAASD